MSQTRMLRRVYCDCSLRCTRWSLPGTGPCTVTKSVPVKDLLLNTSLRTSPLLSESRHPQRSLGRCRGERQPPGSETGVEYTGCRGSRFPKGHRSDLPSYALLTPGGVTARSRAVDPVSLVSPWYANYVCPGPKRTRTTLPSRRRHL